MRLYSIFDNVAGSWNPVFEQENDGSALRAFRVSFLSKMDPSSRDDFELYCLAEVFDDDGKRRIQPLLEPAKVVPSVDLEVENHG